VCDLGETTATCAADCPANPCNHDGDCDPGETSANCSEDCPSGAAWTITGSASPATVVTGSRGTLTARVHNGGATVQGHIQLMRRGGPLADEVLKNCESVTLAGTATTECSVEWTAGPPGTYRVAVGLFDTSWQQLPPASESWDDEAFAFTVVASGLDAGTPGVDAAGRLPESGSSSTDAGGGAGRDAGSADPPRESDAGDAASTATGGCGCQAGGPSAVVGWFVVAAALGWRRRK